jgi:CheY-like chemotaxis protein
VPGLSGLEVLEFIRKENLIPKAKIIMLTNESNPEEIEKAKALNINGYIVKAVATPSEVVDQAFKILES